MGYKGIATIMTEDLNDLLETTLIDAMKGANGTKKLNILVCTSRHLWDSQSVP